MAAKRGRRRKDEGARIPPMFLRQDLDAMAKRRCLMLLSVLSGQQTVSEAIADAQISVGTYYQLETRALSAMMTALTPDASNEGVPSSWKTISRLEARVKQLEQDKRRLERLLSLTKKVVRPGPMTTPRSSKRSKPSKAVDTDQQGDQPSILRPISEGGP